MTQADPRQAEKLALEGKRYILHDHFAVIIFLGLGLGAARTLSWNNIWLYSAAFLLIKSFSAAVLARINPAVLNARGTKRQTDKAERLFLTVFTACSLATPHRSRSRCRRARVDARLVSGTRYGPGYRLFGIWVCQLGIGGKCLL